MPLKDVSPATTGPSTRSQNSSSTVRRGPRSTDPHSHHTSPAAASSLSPTRGIRLPLLNQNQKLAIRVSKSPFQHGKIASKNLNNLSLNSNRPAKSSVMTVESSLAMNKNNETSTPTHTPAAADEVGDNKGNDNQSTNTENKSQEKKPKETPPIPPPEAWQQTLEQLKVIGQQVSKLDKIEKTTDKLSLQMESLVHRTAMLEDLAQNASTRFSNIESQITDIQDNTVKTNDLEIRLQRLKNDIQQENDKRISDLQQEISVHKKQLETFRKQSEVQKKEAENKQEIINSLKKKIRCPQTRNRQPENTTGKY